MVASRFIGTSYGRWGKNGIIMGFHNRSNFTTRGTTNIETKGRNSQYRDSRTSKLKVGFHNTGIHEHRTKRSKFTTLGFTNIETKGRNSQYRDSRTSKHYRISYELNCFNRFFKFFIWRCGPARARASSFTRFLDHTERRTTVGRTPLDE